MVIVGKVKNGLSILNKDSFSYFFDLGNKVCASIASASSDVLIEFWLLILEYVSKNKVSHMSSMSNRFLNLSKYDVCSFL